MKKRLLSAFIALALCLTLLPAPAWAAEADAPEGGAPAADEQPAVQSEPAPQAAVQAAEVPAENAVAQVGNVNYANITDAFAAVKKNGGTLTLLANCKTPNTSEKFDISGNYTLDLNGRTLTGRLYLSETSTSLTVKDSGTGGKIQATAGWSPLWVDGGTVTIESGTLATEKENIIALAFGYNDACKTLTITGGSFETGRVQTGSDGGETVISGGDFHELRVNGDSKRVTLSGGTFDTVTRYNGSTIAPTDLLADGYTFVDRDTGAEVSTSQEAALTNVKVVSKETANASASLTVDGTETPYGTFEEALTAAQQTRGGTLTLLSNVNLVTQVYVNSGTFTLDLNGHTLTSADFNTMIVNGGSMTIQDSAGNGKLGNSSKDDTAVWCGGGTVTVLSGSITSKLFWESGTVSLQGGAFRSLNRTAGSWLSAIPERKALERDGKITDASAKELIPADGFYVLADHEEHTWENGKCACGWEHTDHKWKDGVCTVCGFACPHNAGATEADGVWACNTCGQTVTAMVTAPGGTITYYADGRLDNGNVKSGLYFAIKAAETDSTVAALGGEYSGGYVTGNKTLTLDVSNGKTISGILYVGEGENDTGNKLIVRGSTEISDVIVAPGDNTLDLTGWTGRIGSLTVQNGGKATLNGGTFATLNFNGAAVGSLLASGYAFQNVGTGEYVEYSSTANMENVKVVKCPHSGVTLKGDHTGAECKYCGASFAATLDDAPYGTIDEAVTDWLVNGGTLKLYADYTAATEKATWTIVSGEHSIDLNGHMMSVQNDGAFKPTNNMHLTVTDGTARGQITNILLDGSQGGSFTLESGYVGNLEMTGGAVVALKGGSVDNLDVQNSSANTNLSIQGGSIGQLNIKDWADGMHVSATSGSLGAYNLPSGKILADVLDHQYYAEGTSLDKHDAAAQSWEKFVIQQAPYDFGSTSKAADVPINGSIPFMVDSPSENVGVYEVKWYRRTTSGAEHMVENKVADVNVGDRLDVFCVITGVDRPGGAMKWQVAVKDYTIKVVPARLNGATVTLDHDSFVFDGNSHTPTVTSVTLDNKALTNDDYTVSVDKKTNAGTYELIVNGKGNYTGKVEIPWTITKRIISVKDVTLSDKTYDGKVEDDPNKVTGVNFENLPDSVTFTKNTDYTIASVTYDSPNANVENLATVRVKLEGLAAVNYAFNADGQSYVEFRKENVAIQKADADTVEPIEFSIANGVAKTYTIPLPALPKPTAPCEYGQITYGSTPTVTMDVAGYYTDGAKVENGKLLLPIEANDTEDTGKIGTVTITVSTTNYHDFPLAINVNATNKIVPTGEPTLSAKTLTYGQALSAIKLSGKLHDNVNNKDIEGTFTWANGTVKPSAGSYEAAWKFTPTDGDTYAETTGTVSITVNKAKLTGAPTYTRITAAKKTLADAALKPNASWPTGTIQWVDKDGKKLPDTTEVKANTSYKWIFTPTGADAANYTTATGELTLYSVSTGGSSSGSTVKTDTVTNPDGSVTKTETKSDGTKIQTTTGKDGSVSKTTTNPNGSSVTENKAADGSTGTVKTDKNGQTTAETTLSGKAVEDAKKNGEPVTAPVEVEASRNSNTAPTVKVELPKGTGETKVEIPVSNVKPGTVAVLVHADGTEEIVKNSLPTADGIQLTVNGGATVKIVDNSKDFIDTQDHWAKDAIDFVSARGLVNGTGESTFSPNAPTTRAQLWTILARQVGADLTGGSVWYEKSMTWAKENGISDGSNPNGNITREQLAAMLWRYAGSPAGDGDLSSFQDSARVSSYAVEALRWAVGEGLISGTDTGMLAPQSNATQAQVATILKRFVESLSK